MGKEINENQERDGQDTCRSGGFAHALGIILFVCALAFMGFAVWKSYPSLLAFAESRKEIDVRSTLIEMLDISELYTSEFIYNGVVDLDEADVGKGNQCKVLYHARVRTSVDMSKIDFAVDEENKTVTPIIPDISIENVEIDNVSFIPASTQADYSAALSACEEEAKAEAEKKGELFDSARESLKFVIGSLSEPILEKQGYVLVWD